MIDDDTPRSYASPRDDRFFTPRTIARSNSQSTNSDEWCSPRFDGDFQTPRSYIDTDRSNRSHGSGGMGHSKEYYGENQSYTAQAKQFYNNYSQQDAKYYGNNNSQQQQLQPAQPKSARRHYIAEEVQQAKYSASNEYENPTNNNNNNNNNNIYDLQEPDYAALGFIEQDIEELFSYARHGRCEEIERKLDEGLPVDVRDEYGNTMLITACQNGNKRVAKAVLRRGADINSRNYKGNTPLHYCYHYGYGETLGQYLISKGADSDAKNNFGRSTWEGI